MWRLNSSWIWIYDSRTGKLLYRREPNGKDASHVKIVNAIQLLEKAVFEAVESGS